MEGISLSLPPPVVLNLILLHPFVSFFLFVCSFFIFFSLFITLLSLSWLTLLFACLFSLLSPILFLFYLCQYSFFACRSPSLCQSMLNLLFFYFNYNFQIPCLIIPFCEEVKVGEQRQFFYLSKTAGNYPKDKRVLFGFFVQEGGNQGK